MKIDEILLLEFYELLKAKQRNFVERKIECWGNQEYAKNIFHNFWSISHQ